MSRRTRLLAGALLALSGWACGCARLPQEPSPAAEPVAADTYAKAVHPCGELEVLAVTAELASLELSSSLAAQNACSCGFYFDPNQRPRHEERPERLSAAKLEELGARIEALSPFVARDQRAAFDRDVVEPYRRLRGNVGAR